MAKDQIPPEDIIATVAAADGAALAAIRDGVIRRYSLICSRCQQQRVYSFYYTPAHTEADHKRFSEDIVLAAAKHAVIRHTPREATAGGQQP